ncbi:MAG: AtpZ/AtpI family protein [Acholeplasmataceae bacterium]
MEPNKYEKRRRMFMTYAIVMQLFFTVIGLSVFGIYLGRKIDPEGDLATYLAAAGLFLGVFVGFMTLLKFVRSEEIYERRKRH